MLFITVFGLPVDIVIAGTIKSSRDSVSKYGPSELPVAY
jgi:hypothetical protein